MCNYNISLLATNTFAYQVIILLSKMEKKMAEDRSGGATTTTALPLSVVVVDGEPKRRIVQDAKRDRKSHGRRVFEEHCVCPPRWHHYFFISSHLCNFHQSPLFWYFLTFSQNIFIYFHIIFLNDINVPKNVHIPSAFH